MIQLNDPGENVLWYYAAQLNWIPAHASLAGMTSNEGLSSVANQASLELDSGSRFAGRNDEV